jgi:hypothetical protein
MSLRTVSVIVALLCWAVPSSAQSVSVQFNNGLVTVVAQNAPVRQILAEWARLGGTTFVNADRIPGGPVTLELDNVSERQALDVLLRSVSGYLVAARAVPGSGASSLDRILIVPTSSAPRPASPVFTPPPAAAAVRFPQIQIDQDDPDDDPDEDDADDPDEDQPADVAPDRRIPRPIPPPIPRDFVPPPATGRPMPPQPFQPGPDDDPAPQTGPTAKPNNPFGVQPGSARPGVITPVPRQQPQDRQRQPDPEP